MDWSTVALNAEAILRSKAVIASLRHSALAGCPPWESALASRVFENSRASTTANGWTAALI